MTHSVGKRRKARECVLQVLFQLEFNTTDAESLIRGDTPHFDFLGAEITKGLAQIALDEGLPVAFGILTVDTIEQGIERAGAKAGNKGYDTAFSLVETLNLLKDSGLR